MNDSWSSEDPAGSTPPETAPAAAPEARTASDDVPPVGAGLDQTSARRSDRHEAGGRQAPESDRPDGRRERYPWVGLAFLVVGLAVGGAGLALIALDLDRPGVSEIEPERWWLVVGGGVAIAWAAPWFLLHRARWRMAIVLGVCTAVVLGAAAVAINGVDG